MTKAPATSPDLAGYAHAIPDRSLVDGFPAPLDPLVETPEPRRRTASEEARTIVGSTNVATLATLTGDGNPWASVVTYGVLVDGTPVLCLSRLAQHGRNAAADRRASLAVSAPIAEGEDPGDAGRVTLAGELAEPQGDELHAARAAYRAAVPSADVFTQFEDFTFWVLRINRIRWVGGFGRMASTTPAGYAEAEPDPVAPHAGFAVRHLNEDHADALLEMARALAGHTDATAARCVRADRYGLDLSLDTPRGSTPARVAFGEAVTAPDGLRAATVALARRARGES